jgi:hypothetical protein
VVFFPSGRFLTNMFPGSTSKPTAQHEAAIDKENISVNKTNKKTREIFCGRKYFFKVGIAEESSVEPVEDFFLLIFTSFVIDGTLLT